MTAPKTLVTYIRSIGAEDKHVQIKLLTVSLTNRELFKPKLGKHFTFYDSLPMQFRS